MNKITIELSAEDRARLDKLNGLLEAQITLTQDILNNGLPKPTQTEPDELTRRLQAVVEGAKAAKAAKADSEAPEDITPPVTPEPEEAPAVTEEPKPTVTLAQIQQKVVQLAAGNDGAKKAKVREIINAYAKKVSDLPEDKWTEVWGKLIALENEE